MLKGCVYRLNGKTPLLTLLGCTRQRKCECKRCFGSNVEKVLLSIRLVQNKANGASAIFQRHPKFCKTLRLFLYNLRLLKCCVYRLKGKTLRKICTTQAHLHRCTLLQLPIREKRFVNSFFRYVTTFLLLCIACYVQKQNQKNCTFIPSHAKRSCNFHRKFRKRSPKGCRCIVIHVKMYKKSAYVGQKPLHSQKAKENPRKRGFS